jgi:hypothetical protein
MKDRHFGRQALKKKTETHPPTTSETGGEALFLQGHGDLMTPHNILHLQRLIGNQNVQRLVPGQRIQRAEGQTPKQIDNGLMEPKAPQAFIDTVYAFTNDPQHANDDMFKLKGKLKEALNAILDRIGAPPVELTYDATNKLEAVFSHKSWKIDLDATDLFGSSINLVKDLKHNQINNAISTVYHEGRHAEQMFRVTQLRVSKILEEDKLDADGIKSHPDILAMDIAEAAIDKALLNPLPLDGKIKKSLMREIRLWDRARFGEDRKYRDLVMYAMEKDVLHPLDISARVLREFVPKKRGRPFNEDLVKGGIAEVEQLREALKDYRDTVLKDELERIQAVDDPEFKANNKIMIEHLSNLSMLIETVVMQPALPSDPFEAAEKATEIYDFLLPPLRTELHHAYRDLPIEKDAFEAGGRIDKKLGKQVKSQP